MGLRWHSLELIEELKRSLPKDPICYMIGRQDCGFNYGQLLKRYPKRAKEVFKEKGITDLSLDCDLKVVFEVLCFKSVFTVDMNKRADIFSDLSQAIPDQHRAQADLVCETGTLEHIFDIKSAILNINKLLKYNGIILHMSPVSFYRHGFVNFNPSFFDALYLGSGYAQLLRTMNVSVYNPFYVLNIEDIPKRARFFFRITNKIFRKSSLLLRYNIPFALEKENSNILNFFNFWISHFRLPKNLLYCCAYQKKTEQLKIPYDIWE